MSTNDHGSARLSDRVAEEILALMGRRRINKAEMARRLGAKEDWVGRRLNGRQSIDVEDLHRIAVVLGVDAVDLMPGKRRQATDELPVRTPRDPLAARIVATVGEPPAARRTTLNSRPTPAVDRLDQPRRPDRLQHQRRPVSRVAANG